MLGQSPRYQLQSTPERDDPGEIPEPEGSEHTGIRCKALFLFIHLRSSKPRTWERCSRRPGSPREPRRASRQDSCPGFVWVFRHQLDTVERLLFFLGNVFLSHLTSDLKSIRLPPPFLLEAHESQSRQTNESPSQFLVKHASLGGSSVIKCDRGRLCR